MEDWKTFEKNDPTVAINILKKEKEICLVCISNHNSAHEKQIILLMIVNKERKRMALSCSKKFGCIIKRNKIKTSWCILLPELTSFL